MSIENRQVYQADFCPKCGGLIELQSLMNQITCNCCRQQLGFEEFIGKPVKTHMKIQKEKDWISKYTRKQKQVVKRGQTKMSIEENCPNCDHPELKYFTLQTRSADEGSTVFYECENCHHKFTVNN